MTRKYTPLETLGNNLVQIKVAEPCTIRFWKNTCIFKLKKTNKKLKNMLADLQMYTGDQTTSTSMEDFAQY